jgi:hypothetical protein
MKKNALLLVAVSGFVLCGGSVVRAQVLSDGGFEDSTAVVGTGSVKGFDTIPGWSNVFETSSSIDSGVQYGTPTTGLPSISNASQAGNYFAFETSSDYGTNGGAFQITTTQAAANDTLTLTWWAANAYSPAPGAPIQAVDILASPDGFIGDATVLASTITATGAQVSGYALQAVPTGVAGAGTGNGTEYQEYTLTATLPTTDAGDFIGVSFATTAAASNYYALYDSFNLTDAAAVPEPSSVALLLVGVSGLFLMNRFRRSLV